MHMISIKGGATCRLAAAKALFSRDDGGGGVSRGGAHRLMSPLSGRALKAAFVSESYFHEDVHSATSLTLCSFLSLRSAEHAPSLFV